MACHENFDTLIGEVHCRRSCLVTCHGSHANTFAKHSMGWNAHDYGAFLIARRTEDGHDARYSLFLRMAIESFQSQLE